MIEYPKIETRWDEESLVYKIGYNSAPSLEVFKQVQDHLIADTDGKIKQALVNLGWTPPKGEL